MNEELIIEILLRFFAHVSGIEFVRGYQHGPRPTGQYGTINITASTALGLDEIVHYPYSPLPDLKTVVIGNRALAVSVNIYRGLALDMAERIKMALRLPRMQRDFLDPNVIAFLAASPVRRLHELVDNEYEPRSQFDAEFNTLFVDYQDIESMEEFNIDGIVSDGITDTPVPIHFTT